MVMIGIILPQPYLKRLHLPWLFNDWFNAAASVMTATKPQWGVWGLSSVSINILILNWSNTMLRWIIRDLRACKSASMPLMYRSHVHQLSISSRNFVSGSSHTSGRCCTLRMCNNEEIIWTIYNGFNQHWWCQCLLEKYRHLWTPLKVSITVALSPPAGVLMWHTTGIKEWRTSNNPAEIHKCSSVRKC